MRPRHVLSHAQLDLVELLLAGCLTPGSRFTSDLPLVLPSMVDVVPGGELELHDAEGAPVAYVEVANAPPAITGRLVRLAGVVHQDALDLRRSPSGVRSWAAGRRSVGVFLNENEPLRRNQIAALARTATERTARVVILCPLGAHDAGDAAWYGRAAAARITADLIRDALGGARYDVTLVAVPCPPRPALWDDVLRAYGAEPVDLPAPRGESPAEVLDEFARFADPPYGRGLVLFFTGLSGSGKSTVARAVAARVMESCSRRVTLLDGDVVRRYLSSDLGFSADDRDLNVRRIGWVAAEVARHGGMAIACPIAPYDGARKAARSLAESAGADFLLVHMATSLAVCAERDRKGLYALAQAGKIQSFTGVSDPYEVPLDADLALDTETTSLDEAVSAVVKALNER